MFGQNYSKLNTHNATATCIHSSIESNVTVFYLIDN